MLKNELSYDRNGKWIVSKYKIRNNKTENMQSSPLYIPSLLNNRTVKLLTIYSTLHIYLCNIFVEKEKYHEL